MLKARLRKLLWSPMIQTYMLRCLRIFPSLRGMMGYSSLHSSLSDMMLLNGCVSDFVRVELPLTTHLFAYLWCKQITIVFFPQQV